MKNNRIKNNRMKNNRMKNNRENEWRNRWDSECSIDGIKVSNKILGDFLDWSFVTGSKDLKQFLELSKSGNVNISARDLQLAHMRKKSN